MSRGSPRRPPPGHGAQTREAQGVLREWCCLEERSRVISDDCHSSLQIMTHLPSLINIFLKCSFHTLFFFSCSPHPHASQDESLFPLRNNTNVI